MDEDEATWRVGRDSHSGHKHEDPDARGRKQPTPMTRGSNGSLGSWKGCDRPVTKRRSEGSTGGLTDENGWRLPSNPKQPQLPRPNARGAHSAQDHRITGFLSGTDLPPGTSSGSRKIQVPTLDWPATSDLTNFRIPDRSVVCWWRAANVPMYLSDFLPFARLARLASSKTRLMAISTYRDRRKTLLRGLLDPLAPILGPRRTTLVRATCLWS